MVAATPSTEAPSVGQSALYKISADNTVETLWTSKEENIYDVALEQSDVVFSHRRAGRIYQLEAPDRSHAAGADE